MTYELARGRVLHFNEHAWDALQYALADRGLTKMAHHVGEQRTKDAVVLDLAQIDEDGATSWPEVVGILRDCNSITAVCIADQIEAQTKPPRIPEPGLWGVVSETVGDETTYFIHTPGGWLDETTGRLFHWNDIANPQPVRPGIEDAQ